MLTCSDSWRKGLAAVKTEGEGWADQGEEGRARVFTAHSENCESFGVARFRGPAKAVRLDR